MLQGNGVRVGQTLVEYPRSKRWGSPGHARWAPCSIPLPDVHARSRPCRDGQCQSVVISPQAAVRGEAIAEGWELGHAGMRQFCTKPGLVFVVDDAASRAFIARVAELMAQRQPGVLLNQAVLTHLTAAVEHTRATGKVTEWTASDAPPSDGYRFPTTVFETTAEQFIRDASLQNEHFGPVTMFVTCPTPDALFEALESLHGNLTATVHSEAEETTFTSELFSRLREKRDA